MLCVTVMTVHAGLEEGQLNLIVFDNEATLKDILKEISVDVSQGGAVMGKGGHSQHCQCCGREITLRNLGNVMPGSLEFYCDNKVCLTEYIVKHRGY